MSEVTVEQIIEKLGEMNPLQLRDLTEALEDRWGVKASAPVPLLGVMPCLGCGKVVSGPHACPGFTEEEPTEFSVVLLDAGTERIHAIRIVRGLTGLGLKESKDLVEGAPRVVKEAVPKADALEMQRRLEEIGCKVELR